MAERLLTAKAPAHDPDGLNAFLDESRSVFKAPIELTETDVRFVGIIGRG